MKRNKKLRWIGLILVVLTILAVVAGLVWKDHESKKEEIPTEFLVTERLVSEFEEKEEEALGAFPDMVPLKGVSTTQNAGNDDEQETTEPTEPEATTAPSTTASPFADNQPGINLNTIPAQ